MLLSALLLVGVAQGVSADRRLPNLVLEPFPGYVAFMRAEGYAMVPPKESYMQWFGKDQGLLTVRLGRASRYEQLKADVVVTNGYHKDLKRIGAEVGASDKYDLGVAVPTKAGTLRFRYSDALYGTDLDQKSKVGEPKHPTYVATARPGKLDTIAKIARHLIASLDSPRWFEVFQDSDGFFSSLGFKWFETSHGNDMRTTPEWRGADGQIARLEFGLESDFPKLLDTEGNLHLSPRATITPVPNPELEKVGVKTVEAYGLLAGFRAHGNVYVVRLGFDTKGRRPTDVPRRDLMNRAPPLSERPIFTSDSLKPFNRLVKGLRELARKGT